MIYTDGNPMNKEQRTVDDWLLHTQEYAAGAYVCCNYPSMVSTMNADNLGKALRSERKRTGCTQQVIADVLGWSRQKVSDIERGVVEVGFIEVCQLCGLYGVTPYNVMGFNNGE
jgi:DNA-binding XRE family transcriptional regulator